MQKKGSYFRRFSEEEYLKGVNGQGLNQATKMGKDAQTIAKDAIAYSLNYYQGDYKPIGGSSVGAFARTFQAGGPTGVNLYNGNVSSGTLAISGIGNGQTAGLTLKYRSSGGMQLFDKNNNERMLPLNPTKTDPH